MSYSTAFAVDVMLGLAFSGLAVGGGVLLRRWPARGGVLLVAVAAGLLAVLAGKVAVAVLLGAHSFAFAERRLLVELPMLTMPLLVALALAFVALRRDGHRLAATAQWAWAWTGLVGAGVTLDAVLTRRWSVLALTPPVAALCAAALLPRDTGPEEAGPRWRRPVLAERALGALVAVAVLGAGYSAVQSRLPGSYDLGSLATMDDGGAPTGSHHAVAAAATEPDAVSVEDLTGPRDRPADVSYTLEAAQLTIDGREALAFNGQVPGPTITAAEGQLVEVVLRNQDVEAGVSVHWHGYNVPNAEDGVAGVTQDTVKPGGEHTYRFLAEQVGTFWYHSHQASSEQVDKGLYGALVVTSTPATQDVDTEALVVDHGWRGPQGFLAGDKQHDDTARIERRAVRPGQKVRLRLINSRNNYNRYTLIGAPFTVTAVDGTDVNEPDPIAGQSLRLAAGGRYDLSFTMPAGAVTLTGLGDGYRTVFGAGPEANAGQSQRWPELDLARYGRPTAQADDDASADRTFTMDIDRRLGWLDGRPGYLWTVNGQTYPKMPMFMVSDGDLVQVTIINRTLDDHPIHLHGHHMNVREKNSQAITGSPWSSDTLNVAPGEQYVVTFVADNPGIWMDHCHNLDHAAQGFVMHVGYEGVTTPFRIGEESGNQPE